MARFVDAYDTRTGTKLPYLVPEHWIKHPVLGKHLSQTPRSKKERRETPMTTTETPGRRGKKKETRHAEDSR